ncbi:MAG: flagellar brake protein [Burkholderiaceae bacterium]|nr:flagellar brake protein [Burkholderiaceae bacterium]
MNYLRSIGIEDLGPYQVHSRREIIMLLQGIMESKQLVRMAFNKGSEAIVTTILEVDDESDRVVIDCGPDRTQNQRIVDSDNVSFDTSLDRIRIVFFTTSLDVCLHDGKPAFCFSMPANLIRLQRRETYRIRTPRSTVELFLETEEDGKQRFTAYLHDISAGGVGLLDEQMLLDDSFGCRYTNCRIMLSDKSVIIADLQVRNSQEISLANGKKIRRIGCQFTQMPNRTMVEVQRYITKIEREQNARTNS